MFYGILSSAVSSRIHMEDTGGTGAAMNGGHAARSCGKDLPESLPAADLARDLVDDCLIQPSCAGSEYRVSIGFHQAGEKTAVILADHAGLFPMCFSALCFPPATTILSLMRNALVIRAAALQCCREGRRLRPINIELQEFSHLYWW